MLGGFVCRWRLCGVALNLKSMIKKVYPEPDKLRISEFGSGEEFIKDFKKNMYDIIILDIEMKELNGLETAERIRRP